MTPAIFRLVMHAGPTVGSSYDLVDEEVTLGRDTNNTIVINDAEISRKHAHLTLQAGKYLIEDLDSMNGTYVNGRQLSGPHVMRPGEKITLGANVILVFEEAPADASATVATPIRAIEQEAVPSVSTPAQPGIPAQSAPSAESATVPPGLPSQSPESTDIQPVELDLTTPEAESQTAPPVVQPQSASTPQAEPLNIPPAVPAQPTPSPEPPIILPAVAAQQAATPKPTTVPPVKPSRPASPPSRQAGPVLAQPIYDEPGASAPGVSHARPVPAASTAVEAEPVEDEETSSAFDTRWILLGCAGLLIVACLAIAAFMFWVDAGGEARWCQFFSFVPFFVCPP